MTTSIYPHYYYTMVFFPLTIGVSRKALFFATS